MIRRKFKSKKKYIFRDDLKLTIETTNNFEFTTKKISSERKMCTGCVTDGRKVCTERDRQTDGLTDGPTEAVFETFIYKSVG